MLSVRGKESLSLTAHDPSADEVLLKLRALCGGTLAGLVLAAGPKIARRLFLFLSCFRSLFRDFFFSSKRERKILFFFLLTSPETGFL